jgi:hypothetical protein
MVRALVVANVNYLLCYYLLVWTIHAGGGGGLSLSMAMPSATIDYIHDGEPPVIRVMDSVVALNRAYGSGGGVYAELIAGLDHASWGPKHAAVLVRGLQTIGNRVTAAAWGLNGVGGNVRVSVTNPFGNVMLQGRAFWCLPNPNPSQSAGVLQCGHAVDVVVMDSVIIGGTASCLMCVGGGLSVSSGGNITLKNVTIESCSAGIGGGLALGDDRWATCDAALSFVNLSGNTATYGGAALIHQCSGNLSINASSLSLVSGTQQV